MKAPSNSKSGCAGLFLPFIQRLKAATSPHTAPEPIQESLPYRQRDDFLSPAEFSFYKILVGQCGSRFTIQSKVRLADIFFVARPNENMSYFNRIAQRHVDFLVCESQTMKPQFGIELDDASHQRSSRQQKDEFLDNVFHASGLPLVRIPVQREYSPREVAAQLAPYLPDQNLSPQLPMQAETSQPASLTPFCPKCGIPMVVRTVKQGEHQGKQFFGCQNYPRCREMKPIQ